MRLFHSVKVQIAAVVLLAAAWKAVFLFWDVVPFNSDEAVVALMARHILQGERPIFFYGQSYMGCLDAFLVALGFFLFGQQVWVIRLIQGVLYLGTVLSTIWIGKIAFDSLQTGVIAGFLIAIPTVNVMLYTTASLSGYGETLLLGNLMVLSAMLLKKRSIAGGAGRMPWPEFILWGVAVGCGLWADGLALVYAIPAGIYLLLALWRYRRSWLAGFILAAGAGILLGSLPWWLYAVAHGPAQLIQELLGSAVAVEQTSWLARTLNHLVNFLLLGVTAIFGLRPPWEARWLAIPLLPVVLAVWLITLGVSARQLFRNTAARWEKALLWGIIATLVAGFLFTAFGVDPSGRYFLPLAAPMALLTAQALPQLAQKFPRQRWLAPALIMIVVGYQFWGTLECALRFPPGLTTQFYEPTIIDHRADNELIDFLKREGETRGYGNYWVTYPLAFKSNEELIFIPRLPYHSDLRYTPRDDRYAPYTDAVTKSDRVAYITTHNPPLDDYLQIHFNRIGVTYQEKQIGDYHIYYRLSRVVRPEEIGLGMLKE
jgi:4-amino-4-deoxy-L-arabinose transferase-like glycosyltransferase